MPHVVQRTFLLPLLLAACGDSSPGEPAAAREPARLVAVAGGGQSAVVGRALAQPLIVEVVDVDGAALPDVPVEWRVESGAGSIAAASARSDAAGRSRGNWTLGPAAGEQRVVATALQLDPVRFRATAVAGAAAVLEVAGGDRQGAAVGTAVPVPPSVRVLDGAGNPVAGVVVRFDVRSGGGWIVADSVQTDADGAARTIWYLGPSPGGPHALRADAGIGLTAELTAQAMPADPALTYFGRNDYIEYLPGTLPIIVSAAHGGHLLPDELPERSWGVTVRDTNTQELARQIAQAFVARTGRAPHIIISRLHRRKLDANRDIEEAAQGSFFAEWAWREFQGFIDVAKQAAAGAHGGGFYIDLHGHGHPNARLELGYLLRASELELSDSVLDAASWLAEESSIRTLAARSPLPFAELLRGEGSLGSGFERLGYPAVPSGPQPDPGGEPYFNGGYNTRRHGSMDGGPIDGVQIEAHYSDVRDTEASRAAFASALAEILEVFLAEHYDVDIAGARLPGR